MRIFRQGLQHNLLIRIYEGSLPAAKLQHNVKLLHFMMNNLCIAFILFSVVTELNGFTLSLQLLSSIGCAATCKTIDSDWCRLCGTFGRYETAAAHVIRVLLLHPCSCTLRGECGQPHTYTHGICR